MDRLDLPRALELRQRLVERGVGTTVRNIFEAYGGRPGAHFHAPSVQQLVGLRGQLVTAMRDDLAAAVRDTRAELRRFVNALDLVHRARITLVNSPARWGERNPDVPRMLKDSAAFLEVLRNWNELLATEAIEREGDFGVLDRECGELDKAWQAALTLLPRLPRDVEGRYDLTRTPLVIARWRDAGAVARLCTKLQRIKHAELTREGLNANWQALRLVIEGRDLPETAGVVRGFLKSIDTSAGGEFETFLALLTDIAQVLGEKQPSPQVWFGMLDACLSERDDLWREAQSHTDAPVGEGIGEIAPAYAAARSLMATPAFQSRIGSLFSDEACRAAIRSSDVLFRLGAVALVAGYASASQLAAWLKTSSNGRSELDRALDGRTAPRRWGVLRDAASMLDRAKEAQPAIERLRSSLPEALRDMPNFLLASKAYAFASSAHSALSAKLEHPEPKFTATGQWETYIIAMMVRRNLMLNALGAPGDTWQGLWERSTFGDGDYPVAPIRLSSPAPAHDPGSLGYAGGYTFQRQVMEAASRLGLDTRSVLVPVLTVPVRAQWWDNPPWLAGAPSTSELGWFMKWLAATDPWFGGSVFAPLTRARGEGAPK